MLTHSRELWFKCGLLLHFPPLAVCPQPLPHPPDDGLPHPTTGNTSLLGATSERLYSLLPAHTHTHTNKVLVGHGLEVPSSVRENGSAVSFIFDGKARLAQSHIPDPTNHIADCFHVCLTVVGWVWLARLNLVTCAQRRVSTYPGPSASHRATSLSTRYCSMATTILAMGSPTLHPLRTLTLISVHSTSCPWPIC